MCVRPDFGGFARRTPGHAVNVSAATAATLATWEHLAGDERAADRELLRVMAWAIDQSIEAVEGGAAALPLINACRYYADQLRRLAPASETTDGLDDALAAAWDD